MDLEYRLLSPAELAQGLATLDGWGDESGKLGKTFAFDAYLDGVAFASAVGYLAEKLDHHPDLEIGWRKVRVTMNTHAVGGLSPYDLELARRIDGLG